MTHQQRLWQLLNYLWQRFLEDDCATRAASLTYTTLLSLVPVMIVSFFVLSWFPIFDGVSDRLQAFVVANFVADSANIIGMHLHQFLQQMRVLPVRNLGFLGLVAALMVYNMVHAFNAIWRVRLRRHLAISFLFYLLVLLFAPLLFGILMVMSSYLSSLPLLAFVFKKVVSIPFLLTHIIPYFAAWGIFTFFNWMLPSCPVKLKYAVFAGLVTTLLFEIAKYLFALYLLYFPTYQLLYGALATIPIFLVWIYVSWVIILFGAVVCHISAVGLPR